MSRSHTFNSHLLKATSRFEGYKGKKKTTTAFKEFLLVQKVDKHSYRGRRGGKGMTGSLGMVDANYYTSAHLGWINNKVLLYSTRNYV